VELRVQRPGGTEWTTLASGGTSIGGQRRDGDLDAGTHTYEIRQRVRVPDPEHPGQTIEEWQSLGGAAVELDGRKLNGTLLYDETVSGTGTVMSVVTVPADFTLTIEDAAVAKGSPSAYVDVYGNVAIGSAVHVEPAILLWEHAYHFTAPGRVNLAFVSGRADRASRAGPISTRRSTTATSRWPTARPTAGHGLHAQRGAGRAPGRHADSGMRRADADGEQQRLAGTGFDDGGHRRSPTAPSTSAGRRRPTGRATPSISRTWFGTARRCG
jgi:hypothetical protein